MICRIEAINYRGLRHVSQELQPFEVLVGPNASGKSTFLDVPAFISDFVRDGLDAAVLYRNGASTGRARRLDELIFNGNADRFEIVVELAVPDSLVRSNEADDVVHRYNVARYEISIGKTRGGRLDVQDETLWLIDSDAVGVDMPPDGWFPVLPGHTLFAGITEPPPYHWALVMRRDPDNHSNGMYFGEREKRSGTYRVGLQRSILIGLPEDPEQYPVAIWVRDLLRDGILRLALNSAAMRRPVSPSASRAFDVEGANLPLVIQDLQNNNPTGYGDWIAHIRTILPDVEAIQTYERPEDRFLYLSVRYVGLGEPVPSWLVSDGTLRLMALTLLPYLQDESRVYLIEEPEDGIHPRAIEGVYQSLSSVYGGQVLVATHSPLFLGLADPTHLLVFSKDSTGAVHIVRGDQHPALDNWRGQADLSTLYAAGVLG